MRRFDGSADPESSVVMKRKTCFFPGWVGCIIILMISQFYPHFPARLRFHRGACPQSMREWMCCPHASCNILDRYKVFLVDQKSLSKPVLLLGPSPTVIFCEFSTQAASTDTWWMQICPILVANCHAMPSAGVGQTLEPPSCDRNQVQEGSARKGHLKH